MLNETELVDAMAGIDEGLGFSLLFSDLNIDATQYTSEYLTLQIALLHMVSDIVSISGGASGTWQLPFDIPSTKGWIILDMIQHYERTDFDF